ncbi:MAG: hypothetical protein QOE33_1336 [Acidobacteriota bacterium]|nr:hypothetical protein [Acidobacteriota bacterium]
MKLKIFVATLAIIVAWFAGHHLFHAGHIFHASSGGAQSFTVGTGANEQIVNDSYTLAPGARVEVSGINGPVEIVTTDSNVAEIHVENYVSDARDLEYHKITVEHGADFLTVRAENRGNGGWGFLRWLVGHGGGGRSAHQHVLLKVPRQVEVATSGINGEVRVGELEGAVRVSGVNGEVTVARAAGDAQFSGVNGNVTFGVANPTDEGVRVSGINGDIVLRLAQDVNADVRMSGFSGEVDYDLKNVTIKDAARSKWIARIGAGGPLIRMSGIHGNVHFAGV